MILNIDDPGTRSGKPITITVGYRGQRDLYQLSGTISHAAAQIHSLTLSRFQGELEHELMRQVRELEAYWPALPASWASSSWRPGL